MLFRRLALIAAVVTVLAPAAASAQDFGVMESAETINTGNFKLSVNPMFVFPDVGDNEIGVGLRFGYGFTPRFDMEAKAAFYDGLTFFGGDFEILAGQEPGVGRIRRRRHPFRARRCLRRFDGHRFDAAGEHATSRDGSSSTERSTSRSNPSTTTRARTSPPCISCPASSTRFPMISISWPRQASHSTTTARTTCRSGCRTTFARDLGSRIEDLRTDLMT